MPAPMFELRAVTRRYDGVVGLDHLDVVLPQHQTTVLIGPSGCGKSTLVRLLLGLVTPDGGEVRFQGHPIATHDLESLRRRVGYVVQGGGLFPHLTAERNTALLARYLGWDEGRVTSRISVLLELVRLPREVLGRYPSEMSGGQAQRVSLMRALMLDPDVLLLDEPLGALDPMTRADLQSDLKAIFERLSKTVVLVTHDLGEAVYLAETITLLHDGRVVQTGTYQELLQQPASPFVSQFIHAQRTLPDAGDPA